MLGAENAIMSDIAPGWPTAIHDYAEHLRWRDVRIVFVYNPAARGPQAQPIS